MIFIRYFIVLAIVATSLQLHGQTVTGTVYELNEETKEQMPLPGVNILWAGTEVGTTSDMDGGFQLPVHTATNKLVFRYIGYQADTITVVNSKKPVVMALRPGTELSGVTVEAGAPVTGISGLSSINQEQLSGEEFKKAACCNLSESFETNATVDVSYADGVTGAKEIRMLGLDGSYTQFTVENIPGLRGLGRTYGMNYLPGTWLQSIQISKGVGSVANGYESMTGQINIELKKPDESPRFFMNLYGNHMGRTEASIDLAKVFTPKVSTMLFVHGSLMRTEMDHNNNDGFLDMPLTRQANVFNRWIVQIRPTLRMQIGVRGVYEDRRSGQLDFDEGRAPEGQAYYGTKLTTKRIEGFSKLGKVFKKGVNASMGWQNKFVYHQQNGYYGLRHYDGNNQTYYSNLLFQTNINTTAHLIRTGASFMYDSYEETFDTKQQIEAGNPLGVSRQEMVPGVFAEYTYSHLDVFSLVAGMRADYHNLYGLFWSPRLHLRYNPAEKTTLRLSAGRGYRVANIFADNTNILVSNRAIVIQEELRPEVSWNMGASFTQKFEIAHREGIFNLDYYHTEFEDQVVLDLDQSRYQSIFYNLQGRSFSNSVQVDAMLEVVRGLNMKLAYKFNDVRVHYQGGLRQQVLVPMHSGLYNVAYTTRKKNWKFDATMILNGRSRLPQSYSSTELSEYGDRSPVYVRLNAQITKIWRRQNLELYAGCENITGFKQRNPILSPDDPFGPDFDASSVWGPIQGQIAYLGLRFMIE